MHPTHRFARRAARTRALIAALLLGGATAGCVDTSLRGPERGEADAQASTERDIGVATPGVSGGEAADATRDTLPSDAGASDALADTSEDVTPGRDATPADAPSDDARTADAQDPDAQADDVAQDDARNDAGGSDAMDATDARDVSPDTVSDAVPEVDSGAPCVDTDNDGYGVGEACVDVDCDPDDERVFPGAAELCDGRDNDCDGAMDEGLPTLTLYPDTDDDGYGDATGTTRESCAGLAGFVEDATDCDDGAREVNPGAAEACDGVDENCNGVPDDGADCPCVQEFFGGNSYLFCPELADWTVSRDSCAAIGYALVRIDGEDENRFVRDTAAAWPDLCANTCEYAGDADCDDGGPASDFAVCAYGSDCADCGTRTPPDKLWLGFNDREREGDWRWLSGAGGYDRWAAGEPNDAGGEDCAEMYLSTGEWNDTECSGERGIVCEAQGE